MPNKPTTWKPIYLFSILQMHETPHTESTFRIWDLKWKIILEIINLENLIKIGLETVPRHTQNTCIMPSKPHYTHWSHAKPLEPLNTMKLLNYFMWTFQSAFGLVWMLFFFLLQFRFAWWFFFIQKILRNSFFHAMKPFYHFKIEDGRIGEMERFAVNLPIWMANTSMSTRYEVAHFWWVDKNSSWTRDLKTLK